MFFCRFSVPLALHSSPGPELRVSAPRVILEGTGQSRTRHSSSPAVGCNCLTLREDCSGTYEETCFGAPARCKLQIAHLSAGPRNINPWGNKAGTRQRCVRLRPTSAAWPTVCGYSRRKAVCYIQFWGYIASIIASVEIWVWQGAVGKFVLFQEETKFICAVRLRPEENHPSSN
jgi:hypothetical protein